MILRIDDVIATAKSAGPPPGAEGGMPPGMGGMPDMGGMMQFNKIIRKTLERYYLIVNRGRLND